LTDAIVTAHDPTSTPLRLVVDAGVIRSLASTLTPLPKSIEFHDRQLHARRDRSVDRLKKFQSPQDLEERQRLHRLAALDLLHRRAAYAARLPSSICVRFRRGGVPGAAGRDPPRRRWSCDHHSKACYPKL